MKWVLFILLFLALWPFEVGSKDKELKVKKGNSFQITMRSNPTTGYMWYWEKGAAVEGVDSVGHQYHPPKSDLIGAGGHEVWIFKAKKRGTFNLVFGYLQPWEKKQPIETMLVKVTVY